MKVNEVEEDERTTGGKSRKDRRKRKFRWGQLAASSRHELRFYHRCPRGFSSCKVIVKGFLRLFFYSLALPSAAGRFFLGVILSLALFVHTELEMLSLSHIPIPLRRFFFARTPLRLFLHFLPANLFSRLLLCSSATLVFIFPSSYFFHVSDVRSLFRRFIWERDLSAANGNNISFPSPQMNNSFRWTTKIRVYQFRIGTVTAVSVSSRYINIKSLQYTWLTFYL